MKLKKFFSGRNVYCIVSVVILAALLTIGSIALGPRIIEASRNPEQFRELLGSDGIKSYLIFIGIQIAQIIFAFIPGEFVEIGAGYVYGSIKGLILCTVGALMATTIIFWLTRGLGNKFTSIMIDSRNLKRLKFLQNEKKLEILFALLYFVPGTPKDLITYFAGVTRIKFKVFIIISTFCRVPSIVTSTLAGSALGERQYLQSLIIFGITALIGIGGYFLYQFISKRNGKQDA